METKPFSSILALSEGLITLTKSVFNVGNDRVVSFITYLSGINLSFGFISNFREIVNVSDINTDSKALLVRYTDHKKKVRKIIPVKVTLSIIFAINTSAF